ncbi:uncharacterized protein LOC117569411 isoform X1 [Drosophila albomicans]|uniref:Uncharacterized protein LOC117569411 isoform X1 n=2 Tax=Drosophila albomicans TaxID=7291 RepID=A0A6P8X3Y0_DROAB|nr:uncharacterized protein LOC117569411 isoform X1 [Drosophila albomicans]
MTNTTTYLLYSYISLVLWQLMSNVFCETLNECINCTLYNGGCQMVKTGWSVFKMSRYDQFSVVKIPEFPGQSEVEYVYDENLANCVSDGYTITDRLETFVCFWSPLLGCQAVASKNVVNKRLMHRIACKICARYCNCSVRSGASDGINTSWILGSTWVCLLYCKGTQYLNY